MKRPKLPITTGCSLSLPGVHSISECSLGRFCWDPQDLETGGFFAQNMHYLEDGLPVDVSC